MKIVCIRNHAIFTCKIKNKTHCSLKIDLKLNTCGYISLLDVKKYF